MEQHLMHSKTNKNNKNKNKIHSQAKKFSITILVISLPLLYVSVLHIPISTLFTDTTFWFLMSNSIILIVAADSGVFSSSPQSKENDVYDEYMMHSRATRSTECISSVPSSVDNIHDNIKNTREQPNTQDKSIILYERPACIQKELVVQEKPADEKKDALRSLYKSSKSVSEKPESRTTGNVRKEKNVLHQKSLSHVVRGAESVSSAANMKPLRRSATEKRCCSDLMEDNEYSKLSDEELNKRVEEFIKRFNRKIRLEMRNINE